MRDTHGCMKNDKHERITCAECAEKPRPLSPEERALAKAVVLRYEDGELWDAARDLVAAWKREGRTA